VISGLYSSVFKFVTAASRDIAEITNLWHMLGKMDTPGLCTGIWQLLGESQSGWETFTPPSTSCKNFVKLGPVISENCWWVCRGWVGAHR